MVGFIAADATTALSISNAFGGFRMPFVAKKIGMVKGEKSIACKEPQGDNAEPEYRPAKVMIMDIGDIFYLSAGFLENGVVNDKA